MPAAAQATLQEALYEGPYYCHEPPVVLLMLCAYASQHWAAPVLAQGASSKERAQTSREVRHDIDAAPLIGCMPLVCSKRALVGLVCGAAAMTDSLPGSGWRLPGSRHHLSTKRPKAAAAITVAASFNMTLAPNA